MRGPRRPTIAPGPRRAGLADGHRRSAGEAYLRAAISYHFSKFVWVIDPDRNRRSPPRLQPRPCTTLMRLLDPGAERIEGCIDGGLAVGNLRLPETDGAPVALVVGDPGP